jgi:ATP-dependent helicase/nuclease subunit A
MVHRAIQRWLFPGDAGLERLLHTIALSEGLVEERQRSQAVKESIKLLQRLRTHPLWSEIDTASERHHEVPYVQKKNGRPESGSIDLLYLKENGWHLVDFKTDAVHSKESLEEAIAEYQAQIRRYIRAVRSQLGLDPIAKLCFLDFQGKITLR